jgi:hypothetical protein
MQKFSDRPKHLPHYLQIKNFSIWWAFNEINVKMYSVQVKYQFQLTRNAQIHILLQFLY